MDRLKVEWTSEPSRPLESNPSDPYRSWGHHGLLIDDAYYALASDFPTGTRVRITAEILLPCPACGGTGEERSGVCHCGMAMDGHGAYDNHMATEMTRRCESCGRAAK